MKKTRNIFSFIPVVRAKMGHKADGQACEKEEGPAARGKRKKQKKAANPIISSIFAAPSSLLPARAEWGREDFDHKEDDDRRKL